jgi:hypothetical protein
MRAGCPQVPPSIITVQFSKKIAPHNVDVRSVLLYPTRGTPPDCPLSLVHLTYRTAPFSAFLTTPLYIGNGTTDAHGIFTALLQLPDNVGTFSLRAYAIGVDASSGQHVFGAGAGKVVARRVRGMLRMSSHGGV